MDGYVDWMEMLCVVEPLMGKFWKAKLDGAPEFDQWAELHWETVRGEGRGVGVGLGCKWVELPKSATQIQNGPCPCTGFALCIHIYIDRFLESQFLSKS